MPRVLLLCLMHDICATCVQNSVCVRGCLNLLAWHGVASGIPSCLEHTVVKLSLRCVVLDCHNKQNTGPLGCDWTVVVA